MPDAVFPKTERLLLLRFPGTRRLGEKELSPFSDAGGCTSPELRWGGLDRFQWACSAATYPALIANSRLLGTGTAAPLRVQYLPERKGELWRLDVLATARSIQFPPLSCSLRADGPRGGRGSSPIILSKP